MRTINLLPKPKQQDLKYEAHLHSMKVVIGISMFTFVLVLGVQFGTKLFLQSQLRAMEGSIKLLQQQTVKEENTIIKNQVKDINNAITDYKDMAAAAPKWSKVLREFAAVPPASVRINSFNVDQKKRLVTIAGFSPTREGVLELYDRIKADKNFSSVVNPFENLSRPYNVNFNFSFVVDEDLLK